MKRFFLPMLLALFFLSGCLDRSLPPGANMIGGSTEMISYTLLDWSSGTNLLFAHTHSASGGCEGISHFRDPIYRVSCTADLENGGQLVWGVETMDGNMLTVTVNGQATTVDEDMLVYLQWDGEATTATFFPRDLAGLGTDHGAIVTWLEEEPEVADLFAPSDGP